MDPVHSSSQPGRSLPPQGRWRRQWLWMRSSRRNMLLSTLALIVAIPLGIAVGNARHNAVKGLFGTGATTTTTLLPGDLPVSVQPSPYFAVSSTHCRASGVPPTTASARGVVGIGSTPITVTGTVNFRNAQGYSVLRLPIRTLTSLGSGATANWTTSSSDWSLVETTPPTRATSCAVALEAELPGSKQLLP